MSDVPAPVAQQPSRTVVAAAVRSTYAAFIGAGFAFASWASRIPEVKSRLHLSPAELGLVLLAIAAGSVLSLPLTGLIVHRLGTRRTVTVMSVVLAASVAAAGTGYLAGVVPLMAALFVLGFANGGWDVAMNVQGADVERVHGSSIMSRFHAGFSLGTVAGALVGAAAIGLGVPVTAHLVAVAVIVAVLVPVLVRGFLPDPDHSDGTEAERATGSHGAPLARWLELRTVLIGLFVLAFAFAEGTANDWVNVALVDGYDTSKVVGTLGFAAFLAAMTGARWVGPGLLDRFGRVVMVRSIAALAVVGLLVFVFGPSTPVAFIGAVLWGFGASLGFPVGMSAAADDPAAAAGRVSVVASIGYFAFLGGPPLIGFLGSHFGVLHALTAVAVLLAAAVALAGALRPPAPSTPR